MMKKLYFSSLVLLLVSSTVIAASDLQSTTQVNFIKNIYSMAVSDKFMGVDIVKHYGSVELKQLIIKRDAIADRNQGEMCDWVRNVLIPGQDYDVRVNQMKFSRLDNGLIRAQGKNFGKNFQVDFKVQCDAQKCNIAVVKFLLVLSLI